MGRKLSRKTVRQFIVYVLICCLLFNNSLPFVLAEPVNPVVVEGNAAFQQSGNTTTITTTTSQTIIKYDSFDVLHNEIANFVQPNSSSNVMNRINAARPTALDGTVMSNGGVYWLNPAGVIIGAGAVINVTKFVASALDMSNSDFMAGIDRFAGGQGAVINNGNINAQSVYLVAKQVLNKGRIISPKGHVVIAAAERVFISEPGSNIIVEIDSIALRPDGGFSDLPLPDMANVTNEGTVEAVGGKIILAAAGDAISSPMMANLGTLSTSVEQGDPGSVTLQANEGRIENTGLISATSVSGVGGTVTADADEVINSGDVDVSGAQGGTVAFEGTSRVGQFGTINADGITGDGGDIDLWAGEVIALSSDSLTTANAGLNGDGGNVIAYSPDTALFHRDARIEAKGGTESGNGGFVEVSGKEHVEIYGLVDTTAVNGTTGTFLIDPYDIWITDVDPSSGFDPMPGGNPDVFTSDNSPSSNLFIDDLLNSLDLTSVIVRTGGTSGADITADTPINYSDSTYNNLTLEAGNHIFVNYGITAGPHDLTLKANNDGGLSGNIEIDAPISLTTGNFLASGMDFESTANGSVTSQGGNVTLDMDKSITTNAAINLNGGKFKAYSGLSEGSEFNVNADITAGSIELRAGGPAASIGQDNLTVAPDKTLHSTNGDVDVSAREHITLGGDVTADNGNVSIIADSDNLSRGNLSTKGISATTGTGNVTLAGRNVIIDGGVLANGHIGIRGMSDLGYDGGSVHAAGTLNGGSVDISVRGSLTDDTVDSAGMITLDGDVIANTGNVTLHNNTDMTTEGAIIQAEVNVVLKDELADLTGYKQLTIDAKTGVIDQGTATITVTGSELILKQFEDLDMTGRSFGNKGSTDVTLQSYDGYVKDVAADEWATVTSTAMNNIQLQGSTSGRDITTKGLISYIGDIEVNAGGGDVLMTEDITADFGSVILTARDNVDVNADVTGTTSVDILAGQNVTIAGLVTGGSIDIDATAVDKTIETTGPGSDVTLTATNITTASTNAFVVDSAGAFTLAGPMSGIDFTVDAVDKLTTNAKLTASGAVDLQSSSDDVEINAAIDPTTVNRHNIN